jgi:hypothetical protein
MEAETDDRDHYSGIDPGVTPERVKGEIILPLRKLQRWRLRM